MTRKREHMNQSETQAQDLRQAILNHVWAHFREQRVAATARPYLCQLRTTDGLSCAVGCLIPEDNYYQELENLEIDELLAHKPPVFDQNILPSSRIDTTTVDVFLVDLQAAHDHAAAEFSGEFMGLLEQELRDVADSYDLSFPDKQTVT